MICKCSTVVNCGRNKIYLDGSYAHSLCRVLTWCWVKNIRCWRRWRCWQSWHLDGRWAVAISYRCGAVRPRATCRRVRSWSAGTISAATSGTDTWTLGSAVLVRYCGKQAESATRCVLSITRHYLQSTENCRLVEHSQPTVLSTN